MAQYINNPHFTKLLSEYSAQYRQAKNSHSPLPAIGDQLGADIMLIADKFSNRNQFRGYTFIDDMRQDAALSVLKYVHNFDPAKSTNGLAYVTQLIKNAYIRTITNEKEYHCRRLMIAETSALSHPNYRKLQRNSNDNNTTFQDWREKIYTHKQVMEDRKQKRHEATVIRQAAAAIVEEDTRAAKKLAKQAKLDAEASVMRRKYQRKTKTERIDAEAAAMREKYA
jgi:DNA-directed RNA polymerase specialized sigma subunit